MRLPLKKEDFKKLLKNVYLYIGLALIILAVLLDQASVLRDIFLNSSTNFKIQWIYSLALLFTIIGLVVYAFIFKREKAKKLSKSKYFYIGLAVLVLGIMLNYASSIRIQKEYEGNLPILEDIFLDNLPYYRIQWLYDIIPIASILIFVIYAYKFEIEKTPYFLLVFGILQITRGIFIGLTPFGSPIDDINQTRIFTSTSFMYGVYPSGHTGATFLAFLLARKKSYRAFLSIMAVLVIISLLLARGHYSIDIFSAVIFAYAIYAFGEKRFGKFKKQ
jgi:membrane-associated phospholipid phosphatase